VVLMRIDDDELTLEVFDATRDGHAPRLGR
jgi:hypothetical protein